MSSITWYSGPVSYGAWYFLSSITWYMTPLLAPFVTFQSHASSKFPYEASVIISPPCASLAAPRQINALSSIIQFFTSCPFLLKPCQPLNDFPSNRLTQSFSAGFAISAWFVIGAAALSFSFDAWSALLSPHEYI